MKRVLTALSAHPHRRLGRPVGQSLDFPGGAVVRGLPLLPGVQRHRGRYGFGAPGLAGYGAGYCCSLVWWDVRGSPEGIAIVALIAGDARRKIWRTPCRARRCCSLAWSMSSAAGNARARCAKSIRTG